MSFTKLCAAMLLALCAANAARADLRSELADLAARIDYGWFNDEPRVIAAAQDALERIEHDSTAAYYDAYASFRVAALAARHGGSVAPTAEACIAKATPAKKTPASAEQWILIAACADLAAHAESVKGLLQQRRRDQALEHARAIDPENPRLALVEAWVVSAHPATEEQKVRDAATAQLELAAKRFDSWKAPVDAPDWGEPEALAQLGELVLARGETRAARDLIERALLLAPDYRFAIELRSKLQGARAAND